ncbi:MAG TPA: hypothetical protein VK473_07625 [Terriglobales bacterium]|nr:hypothetical protein [Terriglobales bacterium]
MRLKLTPTALLVAVLTLAISGCSGAPNNNAGDQNHLVTADANGNQNVPFGDGSDKPKKGFLSFAEPESITIPAGTAITVRLQNSVSSASAQPGESFDAVLDQPLVIDGKTLAAKGAEAKGRVVDAKSSGRLHASGYLRLTLASLQLNGKMVAVQSSSVFAKGANHNKRNLALIGGGTGAGALIGGLAGGGKGALIGAAAGAGAGTAGAYATGKKDVGFSAEQRVTFRLTQPLTAQPLSNKS